MQTSDSARPIPGRRLRDVPPAGSSGIYTGFHYSGDPATMSGMDRQPVEYRGWQLTAYRGRPWVGCAKQDRSPHDVILVKGPSATTTLALLRRKVDEIEDGRAAPAGGS